MKKSLEKAVCGALNDANIEASEKQKKIVFQYIEQHLFLQRMKSRKHKTPFFSMAN